MNRFFVAAIALLLVHIADPPFESGKASEPDVSNNFSKVPLMSDQTSSKSWKKVRNTNEIGPSISAPNTVESGPPTAKDQRLDIPDKVKSPSWHPGEAVKIMPDLKKSKTRSEDEK